MGTEAEVVLIKEMEMHPRHVAGFLVGALKLIG